MNTRPGSKREAVRFSVVTHIVRFAAAGFVALGLCTRAPAANVIWTNSTGNYTNGADWFGGTVPLPADNAVITNSGTATFDGGIITNTALWLAHVAGSTGTVTQSGGELRFMGLPVFGSNANASATYTLNGGTLWLPGGLNSGCSGGRATITVNSGGVLSAGLSAGSGEIRIGGDGATTSGGQGFLNINGGAVTGNHWFVIGRDNDTGTVTMTSGSLVKAGLAASGFTIGAVTGYGRVDASGGTISVLAGATYVGEQGRGEMNLSGSSVLSVAGALTVGRQSAAVGRMSLTGNATGTVTGVMLVGDANGSAGRLMQDTGTLLTVNGGESRLGNAANSYGYFRRTGGTFMMNNSFQVGGSGFGVMDVSGGVWTNAQWPTIARFAGSEGVLNFTGGTLAQTGTGNNLIVGEEGTGTLNILGSGAILTMLGGLRIGNNFTTATGTVNLVSGTIVTPLVWTGGALSDSTFNFNGGTLRASASSGTFMTGLDRAYVLEGGAKIDTQAFNDTIAQALLAPTGSGVVSIAVGAAGSNYIGPPIVRITGGGGAGATAIAQVDLTTGTITNFLVTNPGRDYTSAPTITLVGGGGTGGSGGTVGFNQNVSGGLTKLGTGILTLSGANTFTGPLVVSGGIVSVSSLANGGATSGIGASSANATNVVLANGGLQYTGASTAIDRGLTLATGVNTIDTANDLALSGVVGGSGTSFTKAGAGALILSNGTAKTLGSSQYAAYINGGRLVLAGGASQINTFGGELAVGTLTTAAGQLDIHGGSNYVSSATAGWAWLSVGRGNGTTGLRSVVNVYSGLLCAAQSSMGYQGGVGATFKARPQINLYNDGVLNLTNHIFVGESSGAGAEINIFDRAQFRIGTYMQLGVGATSTGNVNVAGNGTLQVGAQIDVGLGANAVGNLVAAGASTSTASYVSMGGNTGAAGTLIVSNSAQFRTTGRLQVGVGASATGNVFMADTGRLQVGTFLDLGVAANSRGTLVASGTSTSSVGTYVWMGGGAGAVGTIVASNQATVTAMTNFVGTASGGKGLIYVADTAAYNVGSMYLGWVSNGAGAVYQSGGTVTPSAGDSTVGHIANGYGYYKLSGGTLKTLPNFQVGAYGNGVLEMTGGVWTNGVNYPVIGRYAGGRGVADINGGTVYQSGAGQRLIIGENGVGELNLRGGDMKLTGGLLVTMNYGGTPGTGTVNLIGGTLETTSIADNSGGDSTLNFDGGTLKPTGSSATFLQTLDRAYVRAGGAKIDTAGFNVTIGQALLVPTGDGVDTIPLSANGSGYIGAPLVSITGGGGSGATAVAQWNPANGEVTNILVTSRGVGYTSAPTVTLVGGGGSGATIGVVGTATNIGGGLIKLGTGALTLSGANTYSGNTTIENGTLKAGAANVLPSGAGKGNVVLNGGAATAGLLDLNGYNVSINGLSGTADTVLGQVVNNVDGTTRTLTVGDGDASATFAGTLADHTAGTGVLALEKVGTGAQTLTGNNTFTGGTAVNGGTLILGSVNALGSSGQISFNGGTLQFSGVNTIDYSARFSSAAGQAYRFDTAGQVVTQATALVSSGGTLTKLGAGTLHLTGAHTYSGATTVSGGTLRVTGSMASGLITVNSGTTLEGSGQFQDVTVKSGGTLTPGAGGDTNFFSNLYLDNASTNLFWIGSAAQHDLSVVTNGLSYANSSGELPLFALDLSAYSAGPGGTVIPLYDVGLNSAFDGAFDWFQLSNPGGPDDLLDLTAGASFAYVQGGTTNYFAMHYDYDIASDSFTGNDIALTVVPEPGTVGLIGLIGVAGLLRRRLRG